VTPRATETFSVVLAPDAEIDVYFTSPLLKPTFNETFRAMQENTTVHVHRKISYTDSFEKKRTTTFRYRFVGKELRNAEEGNDWT
jgi:hypothetical protein